MKQVNILASDGIDEVQVAEVHCFAAEAQRVGAVLLNLEADRHLSCSIGTYHSIVLAVLLDEELGTVALDLELGQLSAFVEAKNGTVKDSAP